MFFLPFIALLSSHSRVIDIASKVDYRKSLAHPVNDVVITPAGPAADDVLCDWLFVLVMFRWNVPSALSRPGQALQAPAVEDAKH